jgi:hypothetical protein
MLLIFVFPKCKRLSESCKNMTSAMEEIVHPGRAKLGV